MSITFTKLIAKLAPLETNTLIKLCVYASIMTIKIASRVIKNIGRLMSPLDLRFISLKVCGSPEITNNTAGK